MKSSRKYAKAAVMALVFSALCGIASAESVDMTLEDGVQMALERSYDFE